VLERLRASLVLAANHSGGRRVKWGASPGKNNSFDTAPGCGIPTWNYILVNDGTAEIIKKYEQHLAWRVSQPNQGLYAALNTGFARSTGEIPGLAERQ
jgi:hypothetical protein